MTYLIELQKMFVSSIKYFVTFFYVYLFHCRYRNFAKQYQKKELAAKKAVNEPKPEEDSDGTRSPVFVPRSNIIVPPVEIRKDTPKRKNPVINAKTLKKQVCD